MMDVMDAIRLRIKELREERNLTVTGLSSLCGVTQSTIENITNSRFNSVTLSTLQKICDGLEIDLPTFFDAPYFYDLKPYERKK